MFLMNGTKTISTTDDEKSDVIVVLQFNHTNIFQNLFLLFQDSYSLGKTSWLLQLIVTSLCSMGKASVWSGRSCCIVRQLLSGSAPPVTPPTIPTHSGPSFFNWSNKETKCGTELLKINQGSKFFFPFFFAERRMKRMNVLKKNNLQKIDRTHCSQHFYYPHPS